MDVDLALLSLRLVAGLIFTAHGAQKAFGWWDGPGVAGWRGAMERMHFRPTAFFAALSTGIELIGGPMLALGILTPFVVSALIAQSVVIIVIAHLSNGFFTTKGGIEYPFLLGTVLTALAATGPGRAALDTALGLNWSSYLRWELYLLGLATGLVAVAISKLAVRTAVPAAR